MSGAMDDDMLPRRTYAIEQELTPLSKSQVRRITKVKSDELREKGVGMSSIDTCWTCGDSAIEERERIALAVQKRHDDASDFAKQWINHHGLDRCDCDELVQFIRGIK